MNIFGKLIALIFGLIFLWFALKRRLPYLGKGYGLVIKSRSNQTLVPPGKATEWNKFVLFVSTTVPLVFSIVMFIIVLTDWK